MKRVAIATLGCKTNQFESAAMSEQFQKAGYRMVPFTEPADIYVVNSCTVTARTDAETRRLIRRARRLNPQARIVATGCYAQVAPGELERMPEVDSVLGNREKQDIAGLVEAGESRISDISAEQTAEPLPLSSFAEHTRAFLQAQNGCNSFCAYCIVPFARGRSRSVPLDDVLQGVRELAANGYREVVLTGIHLGAYGLDLSPRHSLAGLVRRIADEGAVPRLRIGSVEPNELSDELIGLMAASEVICPHVHLPLQSGSDTVLHRMGRRYTARFFSDLVARVTAALPDAFIGADVIAGFPGETDEEFLETLHLVEELPFSDLHVFPFSRRAGTKAAGMPAQVPADVVRGRGERLRNAAVMKKGAFLQRFIGRTLPVLGQTGQPETGRIRGLSRNYLQVDYAASEELVNREAAVVIERIRDGVLLGRLAGLWGEQHS
ncbi:tRNA (N(6)-L-threonylcarbamoyladenosine(37)-C(2))-methylthiotransferase MtaB [Oryzomonas sagensis]|uniref:tRNA (N(6)-L-threonylcarbamoyladenosine(37)-C(2))-methylthiotransferase MtaB n=1 Tax=Oryzomonas sagensis TaxID=2603857 RepID=A0ABQ6TM36_9BACT|nr:tRNA (N(6)-L-threonylcarbamoyladenosine(37)-C(2))-methylthiotransferase MtaB [Oryzomonas sagensis]KAB0669497.1 tRNA (N(6)-L-threonylcarbamoyladenosine(37)-C(2))-methylthiotransferase MtaB [Oryzomonas sagensis]